MKNDALGTREEVDAAAMAVERQCLWWVREFRAGGGVSLCLFPKDAALSSPHYIYIYIYITGAYDPIQHRPEPNLKAVLMANMS